MQIRPDGPFRASGELRDVDQAHVLVEPKSHHCSLLRRKALDLAPRFVEFRVAPHGLGTLRMPTEGPTVLVARSAYDHTPEIRQRVRDHVSSLRQRQERGLDKVLRVTTRTHQHEGQSKQRTFVHAERFLDVDLTGSGLTVHALIVAAATQTVAGGSADPTRTDPARSPRAETGASGAPERRPRGAPGRCRTGGQGCTVVGEAASVLGQRLTVSSARTVNRA